MIRSPVPLLLRLTCVATHVAMRIAANVATRVAIHDATLMLPLVFPNRCSVFWSVCVVAVFWVGATYLCFRSHRVVWGRWQCLLVSLIRWLGWLAGSGLLGCLVGVCCLVVLGVCVCLLSELVLFVFSCLAVRLAWLPG